MMALGNFYLTDAGTALLAKGQAGALINFTRAQAGEGVWPEGTTYANIKSLVAPVTDLAISHKTSDNGQTRITVQFTNRTVGRDFQWREFALWAADPDAPEDRGRDILYGVAYASTSPVPIPATLTEFVFNVLVKTDRATNVTITVDSSLVYLTNADLEAKINEMKGIPNGIAELDADGKIPEEQIPKDKISVGLGGFEEIQAPLPQEKYKPNFLYFQVTTDFEGGK